MQCYNPANRANNLNVAGVDRNACPPCISNPSHFSQKEIDAFILAKRDTGLNYVNCFLPLTILLWDGISAQECSLISDSAFSGWLQKKRVKDISAATAQAVNQDYRHPQGVIGDITQ